MTPTNTEMKDVNGTVNAPEIWRSPVEGKVVYLVIYRIYTSKPVVVLDFWTINSRNHLVIHHLWLATTMAESTTRLWGLYIEQGRFFGKSPGFGGKIVQIVVGGNFFFMLGNTPPSFHFWMRFLGFCWFPCSNRNSNLFIWHITNLRHCCDLQMIMVNGIPWNRPCWNRRSGMMEWWNGGMAVSSLLRCWF